MINYIVQILLFQVLFLVVYDLFLQKETFFKSNRIYLIVTPFLSFIIPLLKFESLQQTVSQDYIVYFPEVIINPQAVIQQTTNSASKVDYILIIFCVGVVVFTSLFLVKLFKILKLISENKVIKKQGYSLVILNEKKAAFSFFNYIFISDKLLGSNDLQIIQHELIHCKQKHSVDLILFELLKIVLWFNPVIYQFQKRITVLHEYISDDEIVKQTNAKTYFNKLLSETFRVENISFINQFYKQTLIKKRIVMIAKNKSQKIKKMKYLMLVPLLLFMVIYSSCTTESQSDLKDIETLLQKKSKESNGIYFGGNDGLKLFTGSSLEGKIVPYGKMTNREKVIYNNFKNKNYEGIDVQVVIDKNKDRVIFIKTNKILNLENNTRNNVKSVSNDYISFSAIDEVPIYPGCMGTQSELRKCLQDNITQFVSANFNANLSKGLGLSPGVKRIFVMFKIDKGGNITDVRARAPHIKLQEEAIRVIKLVPKMIPGKQKGKKVAVKYSLPIAFMVDSKNPQQKNETLKGVDAGNQPIYILKGKEISKEELKKIDTNSIKSIVVLKGENAIKKYGEKGKNGVVEIIEKQ